MACGSIMKGAGHAEEVEGVVAAPVERQQLKWASWEGIPRVGGGRGEALVTRVIISSGGIARDQLPPAHRHVREGQGQQSVPP